MSKYPMPDVVVLLPGITGSVLKKNGKTVWGYSASTIGRALFSLGGSMQIDLALPQDDPNLDDLGDGIVADGLMSDLHLLPGIWKIDGYSKIAEAVRSAFDVTEGRNFFQFPYDWRRDNRVAARRLKQNAQQWLSDWRASSNNNTARLILLAHSMGGLVSRYFLECLEGWKLTRALVTFGTPYRGSLNALDGLANGVRKGPLDLSTLARQFTSMYQLLPVFECYDGGDRRLVRVGATKGIPNLDATKAAAALAFHREIEAAVTANQNLDEYVTAGYRIYPVVGTAQETSLSARLAGTRVELLPTIGGEALGGDGTVPRISAIPIEMSNSPSATYAATQHGSLQNADAVIAHLTGLLSGLGIDLGVFRKPTVQVALEVEDVFLLGEPVSIRVRPTMPGVSTTVTVWRTGETQPIATKSLQSDGDWSDLQLGQLPAGAYRTNVTGENVEPAEDSFAVVEPA
jgi:Lecithin:cholesterol acyltransferase